MADKAFGLDIGTSTVKAVWLTPGKNGYGLKSAAMIPAPAKGMLSESLMDLEEMSDVIKKLVSSAKIGTSLVNIALPENQVYTKIIDMPVLSEKELASAIRWEAEQYIPVPVDTVTLDWKILRKPTTPAQGDKMQILLVGAPTQLLKKYEQVINGAGLTVGAAETEILSVIRAVVIGNNFPISMIVHIGALSTSLAIVKEGVIEFTYHIPVGGAALSRAIATDFGLSVPQAEEYKKTYGMSQNTLGGKIGEAAKPIFMAIVAEIKKALAFYTEKYQGQSIVQQIVLSGGTAKLPQIDLFFAQNCEIETAIVNPWKSLATQEVSKEILEDASDYTIAMGLAMRDYE